MVTNGYKAAFRSALSFDYFTIAPYGVYTFSTIDLISSLLEIIFTSCNLCK